MQAVHSNHLDSLYSPLVNRFADAIRLYSSDDDCYKFAVSPFSVVYHCH